MGNNLSGNIGEVLVSTGVSTQWMDAQSAGVVGPTGPTGNNGSNGATGPTGPLISGAFGQTIMHDGSNWVATSNLYNDGTNIGIG